MQLYVLYGLIVRRVGHSCDTCDKVGATILAIPLGRMSSPKAEVYHGNNAILKCDTIYDDSVFTVCAYCVQAKRTIRSIDVAAMCN